MQFKFRTEKFKEMMLKDADGVDRVVHLRDQVSVPYNGHRALARVIDMHITTHLNVKSRYLHVFVDDNPKKRLIIAEGGFRPASYALESREAQLTMLEEKATDLRNLIHQVRGHGDETLREAMVLMAEVQRLIFRAK